MNAADGESTEDWLLPEAARPPLIGELERRVEEALATARASEEAVTAVGAAAIEAAKQARRAAELAERASIAALDAEGRVSSLGLAEPSGTASNEGVATGIDRAGDRLSDFSARADRLVARLRQLQRVPLPTPSTSVGAAPPRPVG